MEGSVIKIGSNNGNALIRSISPILHCVNALDLRGREREGRSEEIGNPLSSEDLTMLSEFVQKENILFSSLLVDEDAFTEEDLESITRLMTTESRSESSKMMKDRDRCSICCIL